MEKFVIQLTIDGILNQANQVFGDLLSGTMDMVPGEKLDVDRILFSESHSRYLISFDKKNLSEIESILKQNNVSFQQIGQFGGKKIQFSNNSKSVIDLDVEKAHETWLHALPNLVLHGKKTV